jgi:branched-chain amino acid aminotransferase
MSTTSSSPVLWFEGRFLAPEETPLSLLDSALLQGHGIFETIGSWERRPRNMGRHYSRLKAGAERLRITCPDQAQFEHAVQQVVAGAAFADARIRATLLASGTFFVTAVPLTPPAASSRVVTVDYCRNERGALVGVKSLSYSENALALADARAAGADEAIFGNTRGMACEGSCTNLFFVRDQRLHTPPLSSGCLPGTMRALVLELCQRNGIVVLEHDTPLSALEQSEEIFLTSSLRGIQPVSQINAAPLPCPEKLTQTLQTLLRESQSEFSA